MRHFPDHLQPQLQELVRRAKVTFDMPVAFLTHMDEHTQTLEVVESSIPWLFQEGYQQEREKTLCQAALDGEVPAVMADVSQYPAAMKLPAASFPRIRSYASKPIVLSDGSLYGSLCLAGLTRNRDLRPRDAELLGMLAEAAAVIIEPGLAAMGRTSQVRQRIDQVIAAGGPRVLFQPIVDLASRHRVGAESLSRFPAEWAQTPDVVFAEAFTIGLGEQLELCTIEKAAQAIQQVGGYLSINVCVPTLKDPGFGELMGRMPLSRVVLELTEQHAVEDYEHISAVLNPLRREGLRLAIDDLGVGYSSFKHLVALAPDVLKLDRSIVSGVQDDPLLASLIRSLVSFAVAAQAKVVAEGVEESAEADMLTDLGVDYGQGWLFGKPAELHHLQVCADGTVASSGA